MCLPALYLITSNKRFLRTFRSFQLVASTSPTTTETRSSVACASYTSTNSLTRVTSGGRRTIFIARSFCHYYFIDRHIFFLISFFFKPEITNFGLNTQLFSILNFLLVVLLEIMVSKNLRRLESSRLEWLI